MVVKGLLDSAGIESDLSSASLLQDAFPGLGGMIILVREEDAEKARGLIAECSGGLRMMMRRWVSGAASSGLKPRLILQLYAALKRRSSTVLPL